MKKEKQYTITLHGKFKRPYFYSNSNEMCINTENLSYETTSLDLCKQIVKDFLDVPETELTLEEIKRQFTDAGTRNIPDDNLTAIQSYYNGRLALYKYIIDYIDLSAKKKQAHIQKQFDIPYEYNHFIVEDDENDKEEQIAAYLKIEIAS